ncbi:hypothetical protein [Streptomyces sp. NPDC050538]|uniref:hypothetical protein n=1 Tax=Streptomyces TaxID=1883 RepID=UPI0037999A6B|nr:hypothetical protein OG588_36515 [Streptomyces prunicolor]
MPPVDGGGGFRASLEALGTFKKRVDGVLSTFESSPGSAHKVGAHELTQASFGGAGSFGEAKGLHAQYERVHERLTALSKNLGLQIEALQIAVSAAHNNFHNVDEDQRRRFWEIQTQLSREHADGLREQQAAEAAKNGKPEQGRSDDKQSKAGY